MDGCDTNLSVVKAIKTEYGEHASYSCKHVKDFATSKDMWAHTGRQKIGESATV